MLKLGLAVTLFALSTQMLGCALEEDPYKFPYGDYKYGERERPTPVQSDWSPDQVTLECENEQKCPAAHGVLLAVKETYTSFSLERCTAFLYESNRILTAGHCADNFESFSQVYFKTVAKIGQPSQTFKVARVLGRRFKAKDRAYADWAAMELDGHAKGISFVRKPVQVPADTSQMTALVVNARYTGSAKSLVLNAINCRHSGSNYLLPVPYEKSPTLFYVHDCNLVQGNSGGALVDANDLSTVLGITSTQVTRPDPKNPGKYIPAMASGVTNARCVDAPGWPKQARECMEITSEVADRLSGAAYKQAITQSFRDLVTNWFSSANSLVTTKNGARVRMMPMLIAAKKRSSRLFGEETRVVVYLPVPGCFEGTQKPDAKFTGTAVREEYMQTFDAVLGPKHSSVESETLRISAQRIAGDRYRVIVDFPKSYLYDWEDKDSSELVRDLQTGKELEITECKGDEAQELIGALSE